MSRQNTLFTKGIEIREATSVLENKILEITVDATAVANKKAILKSAHQDDRTITLPDATDTLVGKATTDDLSNKTFIDPIIIKELGSTPASPSVGDRKLYSKTNGELYHKGSDGIEVQLRSGADLSGTQVLLNNQVGVDVTDLILNKLNNKAGKVLYSVVRNHIDSPGILDTAYVANTTDGTKFAGGGVRGVATHSDNTSIICGQFTNYAGTTGRNSLIKVNADGTLDSTFTANSSGSAKFNASVLRALVQNDGKVIACGAFTNYGTAGRHYLIRLNADGTTDTAFCANASDASKFSALVGRIALQSDGKILVGGNFTNYTGTSGRNYLIRLNADGTTDTTFCANASDGGKFNLPSISTIVVQSDGKILVGGNFTNYAGTTGRDRMVRLNSDGTLDTSFCVNAVDGSRFGSAIQIAREQSDGKILIAGDFVNHNSVAGRDRFVRLNSDGTLDTTYTALVSDGSKFNAPIYAMDIDLSGDVVVGGNFTSYGTSGRDRALKIKSDGTLDSVFNTNVVDGSKINGTVFFIKATSSNHLSIAGDFTNYAGTSGRNLLVRFSVDPGFDATESGEFFISHKTVTDTWSISGLLSYGDDSGVDFTVNSSGQIKYTSSNVVPAIVSFILKWVTTPL